MYYIKKASLQNYCGYEDVDLNFEFNGKINPMSVFFGPNGIGKSNFSKAVSMLASPHLYSGRDCSAIFRKMTLHEDYDPIYTSYKIDLEKQDNSGISQEEEKRKMRMFGEFTKDGVDKYEVEINNSGSVKNELEHGNWSITTDADHLMNMNKFFVTVDQEDAFLELARGIYNMDVELCGISDCSDNPLIKQANDIGFYTHKDEIPVYQDLIIHKRLGSGLKTKVHFKRMSDGERKIATLLRSIISNVSNKDYKIIIADNIEMHIYWKRHAFLVDFLTRKYPDKQFIVTTHSQTFINHARDTLGPNCLYDLEDIIYKTV